MRSSAANSRRLAPQQAVLCVMRCTAMMVNCYAACYHIPCASPTPHTRLFKLQVTATTAAQTTAAVTAATSATTATAAKAAAAAAAADSANSLEVCSRPGQCSRIMRYPVSVTTGVDCPAFTTVCTFYTRKGTAMSAARVPTPKAVDEVKVWQYPKIVGSQVGASLCGTWLICSLRT